MNSLYHPEVTFKEKNTFIIALPSCLLFLAGFMGGHLKDSKSHAFTRMFSCKKKQPFLCPEDCKILLNSTKKGHNFYEILFEFQNPIGTLPRTKFFIVPPTFNKLSSYHEMCIKYLLQYITQHNSNEIPFDLIQIDQSIIEEEMVDLIRPHLRKVYGLRVMRCQPGFISSICSDLPYIPVVSLPNHSLNSDDWKNFVSKVLEAKESIRLENFSVVEVWTYLHDTYLHHYIYPAIPSSPVYKLLPHFKHVEIQFNSNRLKYLTSSGRPSLSKLQSLTIILTDWDTFESFAYKFLRKLTNLKEICIRFIYKACDHTPSSFDIERRIEDNSLLASNNIVEFRLLKCEICGERTENIVDHILSLQFSRDKFNIKVHLNKNEQILILTWKFKKSF